jgi:hypothetical protein
VNTVWRWLRFLVAIGAALIVSVGVWLGWLFSSQRYQQLLTEQLSVLFGARVQMEQSRLSFQNGFGVQFEQVTVQEGKNAAPFFTATGVELLLDLSALWRGELLFRRIDIVNPSLQVTAEGKYFLELMRRLRESPTSTNDSSSRFTQRFTPTLAVRELRLRDANITYAKNLAGAALLFANTDVTLNFETAEKPALTVRTTLRQRDATLGQVDLQIKAVKEVNFETIQQGAWDGELRLSGVQLRQWGRLWGEEWPGVKFDFAGHIQGKGEGPVELNGVVTANEIQVGEVLLREVRFILSKGQWSGFAAGSILRALTVEARLEQLQGQVGKEATPLVVTSGRLELSEETLLLSGLNGMYGQNSQFADAQVSFLKLTGKNGPKLEAQITTDLDLADDLPRLLTALTSTSPLSRVVVQPQGRATGRFHVVQASRKDEPKYDGVIILHQAGGQILPWKLRLEEVEGTLQINENLLSSQALTFKIGQSQFKAQGVVHNFLSARRSADLTLTFNEVRDYDVASFFPSGKVLPQEGSLNGRLTGSIAAGGEITNVAGQIALKRIHLDLVDFLHPFEVVDGELTLTGAGGSFVVKQGQLPGGNFAGRGRINSWDPLRLELFGDFPDLNLEAALALDKPDDGLPRDSSRDIHAELTSNRLTYKGAQIEDLQLLCHWHERQADLRVTRAKIAQGQVKGDAILWPDWDAAYLAPQLEEVDVTRFFQTVGVTTKALTGKLSGEGKIYMPNWAQWDELAQWDALLSLSVENGIAQRLPVLVRLWSVLSMQGLLRLQLPSLPTEGLPFSSLTGDFALGKGAAVTQNLSLSGNSVRLDARGQIDLVQRVLDLKTALVPLHGITSSVAKVPLAGELLARGADYLTTLNFRVTGPYADPTVTPLLIDTGGN